MAQASGDGRRDNTRANAGRTQAVWVVRAAWAGVAVLGCAALVWRAGMTPEVAVHAALTVLLVCAAAWDAAEYRIPNGLVAAVAVLWLAWFAVRWLVLGASPLALLGQGALGALAAAGPVLALTLVAMAFGKDGFGGGDIKLLAAVGLFFSWRQNLVALLLACVAGALIGLVLRAAKGEQRLPFGCGIAVGWWLVMLALA